MPSPDGLLNQSVTISPRSAIGKGGVITYGTGVAYPARVEYKSKMIPGKDGQLKASTARVYVAGDVSVTVADKVTLPSGEAPEILEVRQMNGRFGNLDFKVIYL